MEVIIKANNLKKVYRDGDHMNEAVKGVSIEIYLGEKVAITGPSGCGKTTLLNMLGLVIRPTDGSLYIKGEETSQLSSKKCAQYRNSMFGYVVQDFALIEEESVYENIEIPLIYSEKKKRKSERRALIDDLLRKLGLEDKGNQKVKKLSGGQRQRVAIARAMINNPQIILADEPTGALDSQNANEVFQILNSLIEKGKTLILITHNEELAKRCDRQIRMLDGNIMEC